MYGRFAEAPPRPSVAAGPEPHRDGEAAEAEAARALVDALSFYRGPFLEGEKVGDWHLETRELLAQIYVNALQALDDCHEKRGEHAAAPKRATVQLAKKIRQGAAS